ncbi:uncharacterized protein LOC127867719 [Dreissena polymorpha]|uniref:Uncharacterized protein n=1 Tax=Dreissena polymorpha TaxID=45954 RepID=A0A9D4M0V3_DREPO|nr:uncharacterized protein LOC127867719 [Dreissena polymorpha]KAH3868208.1 hypothetical protein DPMN_031348 [Dreissena polymorpha]
MLFAQGPFEVYGQVALGPTEVKPISVFECLSNVDIKFRFFLETDNKTGQLIAECDTAVLTCYLSHSSLSKYYSVKYAGKGGELDILEDNKQTRGIYTCCATYNSSSCVRRKITGPPYTHITTLHNSTPHTHTTTSHIGKAVENKILERQANSKTNATETKLDVNDNRPLLVGILVVLIIGVAVIIVLTTVIVCDKCSKQKDQNPEQTTFIRKT